MDTALWWHLQKPAAEDNAGFGARLGLRELRHLRLRGSVNLEFRVFRLIVVGL